MKYNKNLWKHTIVDQSSDRSQVEFIKIAGTYPESIQRIFKTALQESMMKEASEASDNAAVKSNSYTMYAWPEEMKFPVDSDKNTIISKVYLTGQKDKFPNDVYTKIAEKIDTYLDLYNIPDSLFAKASNFVKEGSGGKEWYLLPKQSMCKVASIQDMRDANAMFDKNHTKLNIPDRVDFAINFLKVADALGYTEGYSPAIIKYAALMDSDLENTKYMLSLRAAAVNRTGNSGEEYNRLITSISKLGEDTQVSRDELIKLANTIYEIDKKYKLEDKKYDNKIPCAYSIVFNKEAKDSLGGKRVLKKKDTKFDYDTDLQKYIDKLKNMSKADIVGKYGEGALTLLNEDNGVTKLASVIKRLGLEIN